MNTYEYFSRLSTDVFIFFCLTFQRNPWAGAAEIWTPCATARRANLVLDAVAALP